MPQEKGAALAASSQLLSRPLSTHPPPLVVGHPAHTSRPRAAQVSHSPRPHPPTHTPAACVALTRTHDVAAITPAPRRGPRCHRRRGHSRAAAAEALSAFFPTPHPLQELVFCRTPCRRAPKPAHCSSASVRLRARAVSRTFPADAGPSAVVRCTCGVVLSRPPTPPQHRREPPAAVRAHRTPFSSLLPLRVPVCVLPISASLPAPLLGSAPSLPPPAPLDVACLPPPQHVLRIPLQLAHLSAPPPLGHTHTPTPAKTPTVGAQAPCTEVVFVPRAVPSPQP